MNTPVQTTIDSVTVFNGTALVRRNGLFSPRQVRDTAASWIFTVAGLPLLLEDASLRVRLVSEDYLLRDVRIRTAKMSETEPEPYTLRNELEVLERKLNKTRGQQENQIKTIRQIQKWIDEPLPGPPLKHGRTHEKPIFPTDAYTAYIDSLADLLETGLKTLRDIEREVVRVTREYQTKAALLCPPPRNADDPAKRWQKQAVVHIVTGPDSPNGTPDIPFTLSYCIQGARWAPVYTVSTDEQGHRADLTMKISVSQRTGETWQGVKMKFSAAALNRATQLPALPSRRIGRSQPPTFVGVRPAPEPASDLFSAYQRWLSDTQSPETGTGHEKYPFFFQKAEEIMAHSRRMVEEEGIPAGTETKNHSLEPMKKARGIALPAASQPISTPISETFAAETAGEFEGMDDLVEDLDETAGGAYPERMAVDAPAPLSSRKAFPSRNAAGEKQEKPTPPEGPRLQEVSIDAGDLPATGMVVDYREFELTGPEEPDRGILRKRPSIEQVNPDAGHAYELAQQHRSHLKAPGPEVPSHFFYVYESKGPADIPDDGDIHTVLIAAEPGDSFVSYHSAPVAEPKVYRRLKIKNPFPFPLPGGVASIYQEGAFAFNTRLDMAANDSTISIPTGVEERIKIVRNTRFTESQAGIISANIEAVHKIDIEIRSHLPHAVTLELIDRIPFTDENNKDITITPLKSEPAAEPLSTYQGRVIHGCRRFRIELTPGEKKFCRFGYTVSIPAKKELVGGNRRE